MAFFISGKTILKSFKRKTNPVTWTDSEGTEYEDLNPFVPKTVRQSISAIQSLNDSGAIVVYTNTWYTDADLQIGDKVQFNGDTYMIVSENDYSSNGYSDIYEYFLNKEMAQSTGTPVTGGDSDW